MSALELITSAPASELVAGAGQQPAVGKDREREDELKPVRRKRIITKAREEQNRRAQRVFRQRQKEKREQLRQHKAPPQQRSLRPNPPYQAASQAGDDSSCGEEVHCDVLNEPLMGQLHTEEAPFGNLEDDFDALLASSLYALDCTDQALLPSSGFNSLADPEYQLQRTSQQRSISPSGNALAETRKLLGQTVADPYANALRLRSTSIFSGFLYNALALDFDLAELASCRDSYISPFYNPWICSSDDPTTILSSALVNLQIDPPADLRPTLTQIVVPHHASLDLIPLPRLRDRAIMLSAALPQMFSLKELKLDIYERKGLTLPGQNRLTYYGSHPGNGKDWEAAPWFLRKWSMAVDGEDGELGKQSRWWRSVREQSASVPSFVGLAGT